MKYLVFGFTILLALSTPAFAHDHDPVIDHWLSTLMQPDNPRMPCCGVSDAYWADVINVRADGRVFATITDDRDDADLNGRHHVDIGTQVEIPPEKLKHDAGNPTGHAIVFLNINNVALCFVQGTGI